MYASVVIFSVTNQGFIQNIWRGVGVKNDKKLMQVKIKYDKKLTDKLTGKHLMGETKKRDEKFSNHFSYPLKTSKN